MGQISAVTAWLILTSAAGAAFLIITTADDPVIVNICFSVLAGIITWYAIPALSEIFIKAGLKGMDLSKKSKNILPESMGMVAGLIYLVTMFVFIPFPFMRWFTATRDGDSQELNTLLTFPNLKLAELLSALLSIQSMVFLGFADDVLDIRWRFKMPLPAIASIPLLMVYWVNMGVTHIVVPIPLRFIFGQLIDLGALYYVYMAMVAIFCTHSINIMAGINGVEVVQSLVIACSIAVNDSLFLNANTSGAPAIETHRFSLYFILPFIGVSIGLLTHNWYPSSVFIGDTYCYFAGMTFAVVGILAHYSKTLLLFFIPQIFNFILSAPQLFRLVPCPRHRVPRYNRGTNLMEPSRVVLDQENLDADVTWRIQHQYQHRSLIKSPSFSLSSSPANLDNRDSTTITTTEPPSPSLSFATKSFLIRPSNCKLSLPGWYSIKILEILGLTQVEYDARTGQLPLEMTNLTILNLILLKTGPMSERNLTISVMIVQTICSLVAFFIRYRLVAFVYDVVS
ncbi:tunicamycin resistance protein [Lobosporangium transversale]|uniref:UDP-N-acetylglucosamine--dolichyl-phosphate N-acetylglucosaminephosphotransferase n=1 Tax=Lobosporangium transversale TaxID=64571 RepID=A0A1Y2GTC9_9FUNG|nr:glycosyl transferase family 4-domain-containing protein [Lobosporangium transversale]KAF9897152.1 tunicamycin resistance protein [Lobosporangium transversale]ORZ22750.1 glycosyl transferase family 4-domain-containing protein [Lobosporangium transversale]|eukprot:XP_021883304.1 glycosyl transferase family 4-domain-containing protein [Lobosporangium transversale]